MTSADTYDAQPACAVSKYFDINFCPGFPLLPPWRGKVGMGGTSGLACGAAPPASPPPSPSPVEGEGKKLLSRYLTQWID